MRFGEALEAMRQGKRVRRTAWYNPNAWVSLSSDITGEILVWHANALTRELSGRDLAALDWEILEAPGYGWDWAIEQMKAGRKVRRKKWGPGVCWDLEGWGCSAVPNLSDICATDWELAE